MLINLKKGDTVHFRCGGSAVVERISVTEDCDNVYIRFQGFGSNSLHWFSSGSYFPITPSAFDIIRVESVFDWTDVKPGMCFEDKEDGDPFWYIGPDLRNSDFVVMSDHKEIDQSVKDLIFKHKVNLIRTPVYDLEVKK